MKSDTKSMVIASLGNFVQWFDNTLFNVLVPLIIFNFVPKDLGLTAAFTILITYSATLFTRPFGAFIFSHFADHFGRKKVLMITSLFMGIATLFLAFCPPISIIGVAAPAFLLLFTFLHGFSSGGEWPTSSSYLYEIANKNTYAKAAYISAMMMIFGVFFSNVLITGFLLTKNVTFVGEVSWRILFIISSILAFTTTHLRKGLKEPAGFKKALGKFKIFEAIMKMRKELFICFLICAIEGVTFNLFLNSLFPFSDQTINRAFEFVASAAVIIFSYFAYRFFKRFGSYFCLTLSLFLIAALAVIQLFISEEKSFGLYRFLYVLPSFLYLLPQSMLFPSLFETNRAFGVALSRNTSIFVFGGMPLVLMRIYLTPNNQYLALFIITASILSFFGLLLLRKKQKLKI